jgi:uncharacterized protein DUF3465
MSAGLKKIFILLTAIVGSYYFYTNQQDLVVNKEGVALEQEISPSDGDITDAFSKHKSNIQVAGAGVVAKLLPQDNNGSRHQKFILRLSSGQTVLISHNIDLAPRIDSLREGDNVQFFGEYEWSSKGGVIHWTHRDPKGSRIAGWLKHHGKIYQ